MVFQTFENGIFLKPRQSKQSEQLDQSDQSSSDDKYTSLKLDNDLNTSFLYQILIFQAIQTFQQLHHKKEKEFKYYFLNKCFNYDQ